MKDPSIVQTTFLSPDHNPLQSNGERIPLEMSIISGENTLVLKQPIADLGEIQYWFNKYKIISPGWKAVAETLKRQRFEPVTIELPEPEPDEGRAVPINLVSGGQVLLFIRLGAFDASSVL